MFVPGRWAVALFLCCAYCFNANSAACFDQTTKNMLDNAHNCNKTKCALNQLYEIFEPRDWAEELKYLNNATANKNLFEKNRTNTNKRGILEGTHYCRTCFGGSNALFCKNYCGQEIYTLKNKTHLETIAEIKNKTLNANLKTMAIIDIKNKTIALNLFNNTYNIKTVRMLMRMIADQRTTLNENNVAKMALQINASEPMIALNKTHSPQALNKTAFNDVKITENKNRTALTNEMKIMTIVYRDNQNALAMTQEPTALSKLVGNIATPCAAMFMYAIMNPQVCSKL